MTEKVNSVLRFNPSNCTPEFLEKILVGQHELVSRLERSVLDSIQTSAGHHWLIVGPRGSGKTHLLAILFNRINSNQAIREQVAIAYLKEEERGIATFLDWVVRILRALGRCQNDSYALKEGLALLTQLPQDLAETEAQRLLLRFIGKRKILLIVENLGEIFSERKGMGKKGQRKFRDLVQQHPVWTIMASTQALFNEIRRHDSPFYGFFKIHYLSAFSIAQSVELLEKLAASENRRKLQSFIQSPVAQGRIRAIHEITGGNPRLLTTFYQCVARNSIAELADSFLEMIDSLTAYYGEQMQPLPALQQKILEFLCERRSATTVKEIAQSCFITSQTASKQLERMVDRQMLKATRVGRESYYELQEPLFRICFEVKGNMGDPVRLFVDFLGKFYSIEKLKRKYQNTKHLLSIYHSPEGVDEARKLKTDLAYIEKAMDTYHQKKPGKRPVEYKIDRVADDSASIERVAEPVLLGEYGKATEGDKNNADACFAHFNPALALFQSGDFEEGIKQMREAITAGEGKNWSEPLIVCLNIINLYLLKYASVNLLPSLIRQQQEIFRNRAFSSQFWEGMIGALTDLLKFHADIPLARLLQLRNEVISELAKEDQLKVVCRLFDTGVRFIQTKDVRVLLELPLEERSTLQKLLNEEAS
jgi:DNA polymerase III delta prime subunit